MGINLNQDYHLCSSSNIKKWRKQRTKRGWADVDLWNFDSFLLHIFVYGLRRFVKTHHGWPSNLYETNEEYEKELLEIAAEFEFVLNSKEEWPMIDIEEYKTQIVKQENVLKDAMTRLTHVFFSLWD